MLTLLTALLLTSPVHATDLTDALNISDSERAAAVLAVQLILTPERVLTPKPDALSVATK